MTLVLGKSRKHRASNLGCRGWVTWVNWWFIKKLCERHDAWAGALVWWTANHQLPIAVAFWIIWIVSVEECSSLMQDLMQIHCSTSSVILNVTDTQYTCSLSGIYCPHRLVQWSPLFTHAHSSPLSLAARLHQCCTNHSCYINNGWIFPIQTSYLMPLP